MHFIWVCTFKNQGNASFKVDNATLILSAGLYNLLYNFTYSTKKPHAQCSQLG